MDPQNGSQDGESEYRTTIALWDQVVALLGVDVNSTLQVGRDSGVDNGGTSVSWRRFGVVLA